jgi:toxin HigB-1
MEIKFNNAYLEKLYSNKVIKGKPIYNIDIITRFKKTVLKLEQAENSTQLLQIKSLNFEALKGNIKELFSVRVNKQYRLEFKIENDSIQLIEIIL